MKAKKYCPKCDSMKLASEFHKRGAFLMGYCKPCQIAYCTASKAVRIPKIRAIIREMKSRPCLDCGEVHPYWAMDFDHRDPSQKSFELGRATSLGVSEERLRAEIAKCDAVCALCHRYRTNGMRRSMADSSVVRAHA